MSVNSRLKRIEKKLETGNKGQWLRFPDGKGGFIEAPGCRTLVDALAVAGMASHKQATDETERN